MINLDNEPEQLEQASAPKSYDVTFSDLEAIFVGIYKFNSPGKHMVEELVLIRNWLYENAGPWSCNVPIDELSISPMSDAFVKAMRDCKLRPTFSFASMLDAVAFKLTFSEFL